jgi:hypothetical protein
MKAHIPPADDFDAMNDHDEGQAERAKHEPAAVRWILFNGLLALCRTIFQAEILHLNRMSH